jgi:predicted helicase
VEAKALDEKAEIDIGDYQEQITKYLSLGSQLILTDGIEFIFFNPSSQGENRVSLLKKPVDWKNVETNILIEQEFKSFFGYEGFRRCSEVQIVEEAAKRCVQLSRNIEELAALSQKEGVDDREKETIKALNALKTIIVNHHNPNLRTPKEFADFVAQILIFGLLYSHRVIREENISPGGLYDRIHEFWVEVLKENKNHNLRPFRALITLLRAELHSLSSIGIWYDDFRLFLAHIKLESKQISKPSYHLLYEHFLSVFDPQKRFDFGAFYTPPELAEFCVNLTKDLVHEEYQGLNLFDKSNKLIDPCCGTGNFLEQLISHAPASQDMPYYIGFEILPAPYALANYRLSMLRGHLPQPEKLSILLTDTLSDELEKSSDEKSTNLIQEELNLARKMAQPPLTLVIGNPPSSDSTFDNSAGCYTRIELLLESFRPPKAERKNRQNIQKQLSNQFIKFLRWACEKLKKSERGVLSIILPASFAENVSYLYARKWLLKNFRKVWCLDIDSDGRTGVAANSVFKTLQGRSLLVGVIDSLNSDARTEVQYGSIAELSLENKMKFFSEYKQGQKVDSLFKQIIPGTAFYLRNTIKSKHAVYDKCWKLYSSNVLESYIFDRHCSGIKLAPSGMFVHSSKDLLLRRTKDIANEDMSYDDLKAKWFAGQDKPPARTKFSEKIRNEIGVKIVEKSIVLYSYRPFLNAWAFISEEVLAKMTKLGGGGTRYRPEILNAYKEKDTYGFVVAPAPKDIGSKIHRFTSFAWGLPDNDLCKRGNAHVFCNKFPLYKNNKGQWDSKPLNNINAKLLSQITNMLNVDEDKARDMLIFYAYAILCSNKYLEEFSDELFVVAASDAAPRIPITKDPIIFNRIVGKGKMLAELEKNVALVSPEFSHYKNYFKGPFKFTSAHVSGSSLTIEFYEDKQVKLSLSGLPEELISYEVSGYNVIQQWLKFHSFRYTRKFFEEEDYIAFLSLLSSIVSQIRVIRDLDADFEALISRDENLL